MPRRPKRIAVADVNVRAIRGPKPEDRHCWYWQADPPLVSRTEC